MLQKTNNCQAYGSVDILPHDDCYNRHLNQPSPWSQPLY